MSPESHQVQTGAEAAHCLHATGIASGDMYRLPRPTLSRIHNLRLGLPGLRLLHGLVYLACRKVPQWHRLDVAQPPEGYRERCTLLRGLFGLEKSNGNGALARGIEELRETGLFDWIGFGPRNRWLAWRFADPAFDELFSDEDYGLFDIRALRILTSPLDYMLYAEVAMVRRMRAPRLLVLLGNVAYLLGSASPRWSDQRPAICSALRKIAALHDLQFVVLLRGEGVLAGIDTLEVRIRTAHTTWKYEALGKTHPHTDKVMIMDRTAFTELAPAALPDALQRLRRASWNIAAAFSPGPWT